MLEDIRRGRDEEEVLKLEALVAEAERLEYNTHRE